MPYRTRWHLLVPSIIVGAIIAVALVVPFLPLPDPIRMEITARLLPPSVNHLLGQDEYGRDVLSRILWGARTSLSVAFLAAATAAIVGISLGLFGGYFRGLVELLTVRTAEAILCFPPLLLALLVVTLLGPGAGTLIVVLAFLYAPGFARISFAETLTVRVLDYVTAQEALGARPERILIRTILPNVAPALLVQFSLTVASAIVLESGLSFLGLGVVPPAPSWGLMIRGARSTMDQAPWLLLWPCLALTGTVIALNMLCDRLRDVLDPRAQGRQSSWLTGSAVRILPGVAGSTQKPSLLRVEGLTIEITTPSGARFRPVRDVALAIAPGETLAIVGESGSGKTLTALALLGLLPPAARIIGGTVLFTGRDGRVRDLNLLPEPELRQIRGDEIAMVFQDPGNSLNPVHRIYHQLAETIRAHRPAKRSAVAVQAIGLLREVGLPDAERRAYAFPHELSGGQLQRVMMAMAIANGPRLLIADEPTTALDVTIQAQILDLLAALKVRSQGMGLIFVTHNLAVVAEIAQRVCVMYSGQIVEEGAVSEVFARPRHPYTASLIASVPEGSSGRLVAIPGTVPLPSELARGCCFAPRCSRCGPECTADSPVLERISSGRATRCIKWRELA
jgi:peptide/nickel transport system permease protein